MRRGFSGLTNEEEHYCFMGGEEAHGAYACAKLQAKVRGQEAANRKESPDGGPISTRGEAPIVPEPEG